MQHRAVPGAIGFCLGAALVRYTAHPAPCSSLSRTKVPPPPSQPPPQPQLTLPRPQKSPAPGRTLLPPPPAAPPPPPPVRTPPSAGPLTTEAAVELAKTAPHGSVWQCSGSGLGPGEECRLASGLLPFGGRGKCDNLVKSVDAMPIRSPLVVADYLATLISGKEAVEIGSRNGDVADCLRRFAKKYTVVEGVMKYCNSMKERGIDARCGWYSADRGGIQLDAEVIYWWISPEANNLLLVHIKDLQEQGVVRKNLEVIVCYDTKWSRDIGTPKSPHYGSWWYMRKYAKYHAVIAFDECGAKVPAAPEYARWCDPGEAPREHGYRRKGSYICAVYRPSEVPYTDLNLPKQHRLRPKKPDSGPKPRPRP